MGPPRHGDPQRGGRGRRGPGPHVRLRSAQIPVVRWQGALVGDRDRGGDQQAVALHSGRRAAVVAGRGLSPTRRTARRHHRADLPRDLSRLQPRAAVLPRTSGTRENLARQPQDVRARAGLRRQSPSADVAHLPSTATVFVTSGGRRGRRRAKDVRPWVQRGVKHDERGLAMCWKYDHPGGTTEEYLAELRQTMLESGWAVQYVESDRMPFAYTIGLTRYGVPELLVTGVAPRRAARMLNTLGRRATSGQRPIPGMRITLPAGPLVEMV